MVVVLKAVAGYVQVLLLCVFADGASHSTTSPTNYPGKYLPLLHACCSVLLCTFDIHNFFCLGIKTCCSFSTERRLCGLKMYPCKVSVIKGVKQKVD